LTNHFAVKEPITEQIALAFLANHRSHHHPHTTQHNKDLHKILITLQRKREQLRMTIDQWKNQAHKKAHQNFCEAFLK